MSKSAEPASEGLPGPEERGHWGVTADGHGVSLGVMKRCLHTLNVPDATELYTHKWFVFCNVYLH